MIRVCIIEDDVVDRERFSRILRQAQGFSLVGVFGDCESALGEIGKLRPEVVLLDIFLPGMSGISGAGLLHFKHPEIDIIMLTNHEGNDKLFEAFSHGAVGYLLKSISGPDLLNKIQQTVAGGAAMSMSVARKLVEAFRRRPPTEPLTERENEVLTKILEGKNNRATGLELGIDTETVRYHIKHILRKYHATNRVDLLLKIGSSGADPTITF